MPKNRSLLWIAAGLLTAGAGLGVALLTLSAPVAPRVGGPASHTAQANDGDAVQVALSAGKPTVAEFGANACASCREMKVVLSDLRKTHSERITIVEVDLIAQRDYIRRYGIQLMPTQVFYDAQGRELSRNMGKMSADEILARLQVPARTGGPQ